VTSERALNEFAQGPVTRSCAVCLLARLSTASLERKACIPHNLFPSQNLHQVATNPSTCNRPFYRRAQVDFEFQDPKEIDFHGLKALLGNYLDGAEFSSSALCDDIIKQSTVGTVLKAQGAGDELDPIAVMSVVNLHQKKDTAYVKEISGHLKKNCPKHLREQLSVVLAEKGIGLIINERVINVPQVRMPHFKQILQIPSYCFMYILHACIPQTLHINLHLLDRTLHRGDCLPAG